MAESHPSSAAAFVEGGVQEACDDACSICLEPFCASNPATLTSCKHEYHLQCILEWSQRSKECPMCWQPLSLKDPSSQELLDAIEQERSYRAARQVPILMRRNSMDELEFHQVPAYADDSDFEERIMQHIAAAARAHHLARNNWLRSRSSNPQDHPQLVVIPTHSSSSQAPFMTGRGTRGSNFTPLSAVGPARIRSQEQSVQQGGQAARSHATHVLNHELNSAEGGTLSEDRHSSGTDSLGESPQRAGPSELLSFSESLKSRWAAASSRYKETFTKTTRGFKEKLRARNNAMTDLGARAREVSVGVVRALERISLEPPGKGREESDSPTTSGSGHTTSLTTEGDSITRPQVDPEPDTVGNRAGGPLPAASGGLQVIEEGSGMQNLQVVAAGAALS